MNGQSWQRKSLYLALGWAGAACVGIWVPAPFAAHLAAATLLAFALPGWLLLSAVGLNAGDWLEQLVLASGASCGLTIVGSLGMLYVARRLTPAAVTGVLGGLALVLALVSLRRAAPPASLRPLALRDGLFFLVAVMVPAFFSLTNLAYSDYMGDEMNGLLRAISIAAGRPETLFEHTKGPAEVLLPAVFGLLVGRFEPFTLRFPFALAQIVGVAGFYLLARRWFGRNVGLLAALVLAFNGLYLAFGRLVQYQAILFLTMALAVFLAYRFYRNGGAAHLALSSFLVGIGLLAHYDMLLALPPIAYLVWRRFGWKWAAWKAEGRQLLLAGAILLAVVGIFYVPFILYPHIAQTSTYLARIVGAGNWPANGFDELYVFAVMYNSTYYVAFIALLGIGKIVSDLAGLFGTERRRRLLWMVIIAGAVLSLGALVVGQASFALLFAFSLLFILLAGFSSASVELKAIYVWTGASFIGYVFFVDHPRTHLQIIYPGWSVLAALAARQLACWLRSRFPALRARRAAAGAVTGLGLLFVLFGGYEYLVFVDAGSQYILTYPQHKSPVYWEDPQFPFGSRRLYGSPHRLGWQMIHQLYLDGSLQGDWDSNDQSSNLFWYTLGAPRQACYPRYYFDAQFQQKEGARADSFDRIRSNYRLIGQVWNQERRQIDVYELAPRGGGAQPARWLEPGTYADLTTVADFQALPYQENQLSISHPLPEPAIFRPSPAALQQIASAYADSRILNVTDTVALVGYDLAGSRAGPGGMLMLTLYWQATQAVNLPYKVFVHLESDVPEQGTARVWAQADDFPACGTQATPKWQPGETVADRHLIWLPAGMPAADYVVRVGVYEARTGLRMDLLDSAGAAQDTSLVLARASLKPGEGGEP